MSRNWLVTDQDFHIHTHDKLSCETNRCRSILGVEIFSQFINLIGYYNKLRVALKSVTRRYLVNAELMPCLSSLS